MPSCEVCGSEFEGRADARYCTPAHKQQALRAQARQDGAVKGFEVPAEERPRVDAEAQALVAKALERQTEKRLAAGMRAPTPAQRDRLVVVTERNLAIQRAAPPEKRPQFDPATGRVAGHPADCACTGCNGTGDLAIYA